MKRRSFIALALACVGVKIASKPNPPASWTMLSPDYIGLRELQDWHESRCADTDELINLRMDQAGEWARDMIARKYFDEATRL